VGEIRLHDVARVIRREVAVSTVLGAAMAGAALLRAFFLGGSMALLPLAARRLRLDPAVVSNPVITTIADGTGLVLYFWIARWLPGLA